MDEALDKAIDVFREQGFHATSINDLSAAMGLASGSIYKAFKDKREVFLAALDRYMDVRNQQLREKLARTKSGLEGVHALLEFYAASSHDEEGLRGCLVISCATELATFDAEIGERVTGAMDRKEKLVAKLIRQGQADGSIPASIDCAGTARAILCMFQGMRVVGKTGQSKKQVAAVVDAAARLLT